MEAHLRETLMMVMQEIKREEERCGTLVILENVQKRLALDSTTFTEALAYLEEHCAIYSPRAGFIVRF